MSKDIIVLAPNGRRQTVKCTLNTTVLQILEDACKKQGFEAAEYELRHHNKALDLSNTIRFSNLPNKALLEIVEAQKKRQDTVLTIALQLENGERRTGDFSPQSSLYTVLESLAAVELAACGNPTAVYTRHEVFGEDNLRGSTLRHLGLTSGRAVLRLIDKSPEELKHQANVSSVLPPRPVHVDEPAPSTSSHPATPGPSCAPPDPTRPTRPEPSANISDNKPNAAYGINPIKLIKDEIKKKANVNAIDEREETEKVEGVDDVCMSEVNAPSLSYGGGSERGSAMEIDEEQLQRRLNIEQEVTFLGEKKAIVYRAPETAQTQLAELPDDFYDLTVEEVRRLHRDLRQQASALAEAPLLTEHHRTANAQLTEKASTHPHVVVRIQFPDRMILQGVFTPTDTIGDVKTFASQYLKEPARPFHLFTTPTREILDPNLSLVEAHFVPCVLMHFRWADGAAVSGACLQEHVYSSQTSSDAAAILASKYRVPVRRKMDDAVAGPSRPAAPSTSHSKDGKAPKWFKQ